MRRYLEYLKYILRHKWFVLIASIKIKAPLWHAIIHDFSKFRFSEWFPYAYTFYTKNGEKQYKETIEFSYAWNHHQKRNKHHYQYYLLTWDKGITTPLPMPKKYILEMIADWMGAGKAITGKWEAKEWYQKNKENIKLHPETKKIVEKILDRVVP